MLEEDEEDLKRTGNDDDKYDNDKPLINVLFLVLQLSNKGYIDKDYVD
jgi:hypothetical protein